MKISEEFVSNTAIYTGIAYFYMGKRWAYFVGATQIATYALTRMPSRSCAKELATIPSAKEFKKNSYRLFKYAWIKLLPIFVYPWAVRMLKSSWANRFRLFYLVALEAPFCEEILFRSFINGKIRQIQQHFGCAEDDRNTGHTVIRMLISSAVFGAMHYDSMDSIRRNIVMVLGAGVMGIFFSDAYEETGSLLPGMCAHMLQNASVMGAHALWVACGIV